MRPRTLDDMVGQRRLLSEHSALRRAVESGRVHSMILWGPPGCGKTTLALLLAHYAQARFRAISAVLAGLLPATLFYQAARRGGWVPEQWTDEDLQNQLEVEGRTDLSSGISGATE